MPSEPGVDARAARLAQGAIALLLGVWFAFHLDPLVPAVAALCAADAALCPRGPLLLLAGIVPSRGATTRGPALPERLTFGLEAALLIVASLMLWGPASRIGALVALATGAVAAVDATSTLSPGRWLAARLGARAGGGVDGDADDGRA